MYRPVLVQVPVILSLVGLYIATAKEEKDLMEKKKKKSFRSDSICAILCFAISLTQSQI